MSQPDFVGSTPLTRLSHGLALILLGGEPEEPLPQLAAIVLGAGATLEGLVELAILPNDSPPSIVLDVVEPLRRSLGLARDDGLLKVFRTVALGISAGGIEPIYGSSVIAEAYAMESASLPTEIAIFSVLRDEHRQFPHRKTITQKIRRAALEFGELGLILPLSVGDLAD